MLAVSESVCLIRIAVIRNRWPLGPTGSRPQNANEPRGLIAKEFLEAMRRQCGIARRILNIAMPEIRLDRTRVMAILGELVTAGMAQHVGCALMARRQATTA
jgi:hypothetical protein